MSSLEEPTLLHLFDTGLFWQTLELNLGLLGDFVESQPSWVKWQISVAFRGLRSGESHLRPAWDVYQNPIRTNQPNQTKTLPRRHTPPLLAMHGPIQHDVACSSCSQPHAILPTSPFLYRAYGSLQLDQLPLSSLIVSSFITKGTLWMKSGPPLSQPECPLPSYVGT